MYSIGLLEGQGPSGWQLPPSWALSNNTAAHTVIYDLHLNNIYRPSSAARTQKETGSGRIVRRSGGRNSGGGRDAALERRGG